MSKQDFYARAKHFGWDITKTVKRDVRKQFTTIDTSYVAKDTHGRTRAQYDVHAYA